MDYAVNVSIISYLVTISKSGNHSTIILHARSVYKKWSIPRGELDALYEGSIQHKTLKTELADILHEDYIFSDSLVCIYQTIMTKIQNDFIETRVEEIRRNVNVSKNLYHVTTSENPADLATKFSTSQSNCPFIRYKKRTSHQDQITRMEKNGSEI